MNGPSESGNLEQSIGTQGLIARTSEPDTGTHAPLEAGATESGEGAAPAGEVFALEALLAERARELKQQQNELARTRGLLRDAVERFNANVSAASDHVVADVRRERDQAVARAVESEAARAEIRFRLDEVMGHLVAAGATDDTLSGERLDVTCARLTGTVRGLLSALAETQEGREVSQARLMLAEGDLQDVRDAARSLERELAEARELLEFEALRAQRLADQYDGGLEGPAAAGLRGERDGLRARSDESERAFAGAGAGLAAVRDELAQARFELAEASDERVRLSSRIAELEQSVVRESQNRAEIEAELTRARAERMAMSAELARTSAELTQARSAAQGTEVDRGRALDAMAQELDAARQAATEPRVRAERQAEALRKTREQLTELAVAVRAVIERRPGAAAQPGDPDEATLSGMPTYIEAIEGFEVELAASQERVKQLEGRLAAAALAARDLAANPALSEAVAEIADLRLLLERGSGRLSDRPPHGRSSRPPER